MRFFPRETPATRTPIQPMSQPPSPETVFSRLQHWLWQSGFFHVNRLNPEQTHRLAEYRDRWLQIGLSTDPVDEKTAEAAINWVYRCVNLPDPPLKLWLQNPYDGCIGAYLITLLCQLSENQAVKRPAAAPKTGALAKSEPFDTLWQSVKDTAQAKLGAGVWTSQWQQVWEQIAQQVHTKKLEETVQYKGDPLWHLVEGSVFAQVKNRFRVKVWLDEKTTEKTEVDPKVIATIRETISTPVAQQARDQYVQLVNEEILERLAHHYDALPHPTPSSAEDPAEDGEPPLSAWDTDWLLLREVLQKASSGAHKCYNLSFFSYLKEVCDLPMDVLYGVWEAAKHCGWYWRFGGVVILLPKPTALHLKNGLLHSEGGPAIQYPGGFDVFAHFGERYRS